MNIEFQKQTETRLQIKINHEYYLIDREQTEEEKQNGYYTLVHTDTKIDPYPVATIHTNTNVICQNVHTTHDVYALKSAIDWVFQGEIPKV